VGEVVRALAHRPRVTAWSGAWSPGALVTCDPVRVAGPDEDPFALLGDLPPVADGVRGVVGGGWFGYLPFRGPAVLGYHHDVLRHDGARWWYEALLCEGGCVPGCPGFGPTEVAARLDLLRADLAAARRPDPARLELLRDPDAGAHIVAVERCLQAIRRGEVYQANIATQLDLRLHGSPHDAWARIVARHAPARAALVTGPDGAAVSASPELFLRREGRHVRTSPIKGTRPRTGDHERERLRRSAKDAAENVMIVDLMRNDLARVAVPGSVRVPALLSVEPHAGVWHLVSTVTAQLVDGCGDAELLAAAFPPGSVTGAPKLRAVEVIEELEPRPRGLFTGAMGFASPLAGLELNVAIRTLEVAPDGRAVLAVGGGVTVDSTPVEEWAECLTKAAPLLTTLGARALRPPKGPGLADPALGIFETLLAVDGRPVRAAEHLRRLRVSYLECYGEPLTADLRVALADLPPGRLRIRLDARPGAPDVVRRTVTSAPAEPPIDAQPGVVLRVHRLGPAGAERHKFADRRVLDAIEAGLGPGAEVLLVDDENRLLESTRSCVFVVRDGVAATPPLDGRILPGTGRRAVLDLLDSCALVAPTVADLATADGMFLVNALRGVRWVRSAPGVRWAAPEPVTRAVAKLIDAPPASFDAR
jgi:para-aminobenzoate synthetase/4-amino-4-deoxychorismate lyase